LVGGFAAGFFRAGFALGFEGTLAGALAVALALGLAEGFATALVGLAAAFGFGLLAGFTAGLTPERPAAEGLAGLLAAAAGFDATDFLEAVLAGVLFTEISSHRRLYPRPMGVGRRSDSPFGRRGL
jgi:hypothetical protein